MYQESHQGGMATNTAALEKVKLPAIFLMVTAGIGALLGVLSLLMNVLGTGMNMANMEGMSDQQMQFMTMFSGGMGIFLNIIGLLMACLIFFGAQKMMKLESYGLAMAASIVAMIPCISPCCILGLPIGIWALVVLLNNDVKAAFH